MRETLWLEENKFYHVYNRSNGDSNLFFRERNYGYFLRKYDEYLSEYAETYAFCLMPNHFHFLIRIKAYHSFPDDGSEIGPEAVSEQFRKLFISYTQSINIQEERVGSLFQKNFKRKEVKDHAYFTNLVYYIHKQPSHHGFTEVDDHEYPWSSFGRILSANSSKLRKQEVLQWFGGKQQYNAFHLQRQDLNTIRHLVIEG